MISPESIIRKKRFGEALDDQEIAAFARGAVDGSFEEGQLGAMLMAICLRGMDDRETASLTMAMADSGERLDLSDVPGPKADKHSTGGVGDTTSLLLVPLVASCGVTVAKMSGRGLGFTGGTLDKLESIPGLKTSLPIARFKSQLTSVGAAIAGQTGELAPADKTLYALRNVTGTVDCMPLIVSSILSKKIASGCDVVVLDVKTGAGAILPDEADSVRLAETLVRVGCSTGRRFSALVTDMSQPLGLNVGNALEVEEAARILAGEVGGPLLELSLRLGAHMLMGAGRAESEEEGVKLLRKRLTAGEGLKKLAEMVEAQGGDPRAIYDPDRLPKAETRVSLRAEAGGYITAMRAANIGYAARALGAGREHKGDTPDPAAGLVMKKRVGDRVERGETYCELHVGATSRVDEAKALMADALTISREPGEPIKLVHRVVEG